MEVEFLIELDFSGCFTWEHICIERQNRIKIIGFIKILNCYQLIEAFNSSYFHFKKLEEKSGSN